MYFTDNLIIDTSVFIAPTSTLLGKVTIGKNSSIWFQSVLRGDVDEIIIGENTNIQDGSIIHCVNGFPTKVGNNVSLGHGVILHGCTIEDNVLIGMRATVLTGAVIGKNSLIAAGALVSENMIIPPNSLVVGIPAKVKKEISKYQFDLIEETAKNYVKYAIEYINRYK
ncbi:MAG: gamma carbonic anhydrase family protein [Candidatus Sericytochromatia bacterium]|nr:gamma carbonic anhydrase family protein [Candidatus Sericytochromatia bacterium]